MNIALVSTRPAHIPNSEPNVSLANSSGDRSQPLIRRGTNVLSPYLTHCCKLFVVRKKLKPFVIKQIRTLLQKHPGVWVLGRPGRRSVLHTYLSPDVCFQHITNCFFHKPFRFTSIQIAGGVAPLRFTLTIKTRPLVHDLVRCPSAGILLQAGHLCLTCPSLHLESMLASPSESAA